MMTARDDSTQRRARTARVLAAALIAGFVGYAVMIGGPMAERRRLVMEHELSLLAQLPGSTFLDATAVSKGFDGSTGRYFASTQPYAEIRNHYVAEFQKHGWQFVGEVPIRDWGHDLGGRKLSFSKGRYEADLQYAGERADYGWTYAVGISWETRLFP